MLRIFRGTGLSLRFAREENPPPNAQAMISTRHLDAVYELDALPRVLGEEEVPVQVDVVAERSDDAAGGNAEA
jgi:hypothetical protein